jgi:hypothetical protein
MALNKDVMKAELYHLFLQMEFNVKDAQGHEQIVKPDPVNNNLLPMAQAIADWAFNLLTVETQVVTNPGQPTQVDTATGTGATIGPGTGSLK